MDQLLKKGKRTSRWMLLSGVIFVAPAILFQFFFHWLPVMCAFVVSGQEFRFDGAKWVGLENFRKVLEHPESTPLPHWRPEGSTHIVVATCLICLVIGVAVVLAWMWLSRKQRMTRGEVIKGLVLRLICLVLMPMLGLSICSDDAGDAAYWLRFSLQWTMSVGAIILALSTVTSAYSRAVRKHCSWVLFAGLAFLGFFVAFLRPVWGLGAFSQIVMDHRPFWLTAFALCVTLCALAFDRREKAGAMDTMRILALGAGTTGALLACLAPVGASLGLPWVAGHEVWWVISGLGLVGVSLVELCPGSRVDWQQVVSGSMNASSALIGPMLLAVGLCTGLGVAWRNTFLFASMSLGLTFLVPIIVSVLLMEMGRRTVKWMMLLWFLPAAGMAGIMIWIYLYEPSGGLLNTLLVQVKPVLEFFGFVGADWEGFKWLGDKQMAMFCLVLPGLVMFGPGLVYIASLHALPEELYEAAEMEGAGFWQKIFHVTLPRLRPIISMMLVLSTIGALQVFGPPFIMTRGGPGNATVTVALQVYRLAIEQFKLGEGTALSVILFFVVLVMIIFQRTYFKEDPDT